MVRRWLRGLATVALAVTLTPIAAGQAAAAPKDSGDTITPMAAYRLINANSNQCASIPGGSKVKGTNVQQYPCGPYADHFWRFVGVSGGMHVVNNNSNQCMSIKDRSTARGAYVLQWTCNTAYPDHVWNFDRDPAEGWFRLVNRYTGMCLAVPGASTRNGEWLIQWPCGSYPDHFWRLG